MFKYKIIRIVNPHSLFFVRLKKKVKPYDKAYTQIGNSLMVEKTYYDLILQAISELWEEGLCDDFIPEIEKTIPLRR